MPIRMVGNKERHSESEWVVREAERPGAARFRCIVHAGHDLDKHACLSLQLGDVVDVGAAGGPYADCFEPTARDIRTVHR